MTGSKTVEGIFGGEDDLPPKAATEHFLVVGASGSGKTVLIERLLWSLFQNPNTRLSTKNRAIIYDPKQEMVSRLYGMDGGERIRILHPFDKRSYAWDIAADIDGPISARQAATLLIPETQGSQKEPFFDNAVRDLLTGVMLAFINCAPKEQAWTLRDVLLTMLYEPYLRFVLGQTKTRTGEPFFIGTRLYSSYLDSKAGDTRTVANIRATINARLSLYEPIAAVWEEARKDKHTFSLKEWVKSDEILVLGNDEAARVALDAVNQLLFKRMTEIILNQPEVRSFKKSRVEDWGEGFTRPTSARETPEDSSEEATPEDNLTWVILDEVREAGRLDGLSRLMTKGRSKGAAVVLGFQDIDGLRAVYGNEIANEITGQCQNIAILQISNPTTAEWATSLFGKFLTEVTTASRSKDQKGGVTVGQGNQEADRSLVYSGDLIYLPKTSKENGLTGYFRCSRRDLNKDGLRVHIGWEDGIKHFLPSRAQVFDFVERPIEQHYLQPWNDADWERLGFAGSPLDLATVFEPERFHSEEADGQASGAAAGRRDGFVDPFETRRNKPRSKKETS